MFGKGLPAVSGRKTDIIEEITAADPNIEIGRLTCISAKSPTAFAKTPPILATSEQEPRPEFLRKGGKLILLIIYI